MCGIIGGTGLDEVLPVLVEGLRRLEYRGYDSAGVALADGGSIWRVRVANGTNSVAELAGVARPPSKGSRAGIAHTRWATHGRPSVENAHPHLDCTGRIALVHNGIVENHLSLAEALTDRGHVLQSATDTEVLVHLIEEEVARGLALVEAVRSVLATVRGSLAIAVISADDPETIVAARRATPLIVGLRDHAAFLASDIPALLGQTRQLYVLDDDEVAELRPGALRVLTLAGAEVEPRALEVAWSLESAQKGGFDDFMSKEIREQPDAVANTLLDRLGPDGSLAFDDAELSAEELRSVDKVCIIACGSSHHAAMVAKYAVEHWARLPVEVDIASEFRYRDPVLDARTLAVGVSQSGETLDTLVAMREARNSGARLIAVSNVVDSSMAREAQAALYTHAGPEVGVAATKTFLAQLVALELLALMLAEVRGTLSHAEVSGWLSKLHEVPGLVREAIRRSEDVDAVAKALADARDFFYLGRHVGFPVALEGALKLKELAYLRAEGYPAGELKHGPIALIEPGAVVVAVATRNRLWEKLCSNVQEVASRGATVVVIADDGDHETAALADHVLWVPHADPLISPLVDVVPLQLLAYRLARLHGHDPDRPRNLAKVVTVE